MSDKIQFHEECAIIPLTRFNELKANEALLLQGLNEKFYYVRQEIYYDPGPSNTFSSTKFYASNEWEVTREWEKTVKELKNLQDGDRSAQRELVKRIGEQEQEIARLRQKKWYQFIPMP